MRCLFGGAIGLYLWAVGVHVGLSTVENYLWSSWFNGVF